MKHISKLPSKYSSEQQGRLFPYSVAEDIANAVTHAVGSCLALAMLISLAWIAGRYGNTVDSAAFIFYGLSIVFMFVMSTVYHSMTNHIARSVLKRMDHSAIFVLIIGSYTPYVFCLLKSQLAYVLYLVLVILMVIGIIFKALYAGKFKKIGTLVYVLMGWASVLILPQIIAQLSFWGVTCFIASGIIYTIGALCYAFSKFKYSHMLWHIFVMLAVVMMYCSVAFCILQLRV